jgi:hypothetical protein
MLQPDIFWYYDPMASVIRPSRTQRTKFLITVVDPGQKLGPNPIMVGNDRFRITPPDDQSDYLRLSERGIGRIRAATDTRPIGTSFYSTNATSLPYAEFTFSDFDGGFEIRFPPNDFSGNIQYAMIFPISGKCGERWELVD